MSTVKEIREAVRVIYRAGNRKLTLLHCVTEYPPPFKELNLRAINTLKSIFKVPVGFSDHSLGIEASLAAVALGATVIEKHLTLDKNMKGPDHKASLNPAEFTALVKGIRNLELALGDGIKKPTQSELKNLTIARKSLVVTGDLAKGHILSKRDITFKRPGYGVQPGDIHKVLGRKVIRPIKKDSVLEWGHLK
jgi:sialic acid synthase SpsE